MKEGGRPRRGGSFPIQVWLEVDLEVQPIEGKLGPPHRPPTTFIGWVGLTAALEGLRPGTLAGDVRCGRSSGGVFCWRSGDLSRACGYGA